MKMLISEVGKYRVYAERVQPESAVKLDEHLRLYTEWNGNTELRLDLVLTSEQRMLLRELLAD